MVSRRVWWKDCEGFCGLLGLVVKTLKQKLKPLLIIGLVLVLLLFE